MNRDLLTTSRITAFRRCPRYHHNRYVLRVRPLTEAEALRFGTLIHAALEAWWLTLLAMTTAWRQVVGPHEAYDPVDAVDAGLALDEHPALLAAQAVIRAKARRQQKHWPDCAVNHGGSACDMGPECGSDQPTDPELDGDAAAPVLANGVEVWDAIRAEEIMRGYHRRWIGAHLEPLAVEAEFRARLVNPASGQASQTWDLGGKIDVIARRWHLDGDEPRGELVNVEHKTAGVDISPGSPYRKQLRMDGQVSTYHDGAGALGFRPLAGTVYDVLAKPTLRPSQATPPEKREVTLAKYKACTECKRKGSGPAPHWIVDEAAADEPHVRRIACGTGLQVTLPDGVAIEVVGEPGKVISEPPRYKANVRCLAETPDEFRARLRAELEAEGSAEAYFQRDDVVRLETELQEFRADTWDTGRIIRESELAKRAPRNPAACVAYGRECEYFDVCAGSATLDDATKFRQVATSHTELSTAAAGGTTTEV